MLTLEWQMAEITVSYSNRPIIVRQRQYAMVRPMADILAMQIVDIPFKLVTIFFFDLILYFMVCPSGMCYLKELSKRYHF